MAVTPHIDEIRDFVMVKGKYILASNESKLSSDIPDSIIAINNFESERLDRNEHGGGIAFYMEDTINYKIVDNLPEHSQLICLETIPKKGTGMFVLCWYRPPALTSLTSWETFWGVWKHSIGR